MKRIASFLQAWQHFWFEPRATKTLSILRILFGCTFLMKLTSLYGLYRFPHYSPEWPRHAFPSFDSYFLTAFNLPVPGFAWLPVLNYQQWQGLEMLLFILGICFVLGLGTRFLGPALALLYWYTLLISQFLYSHHILNFCIVFTILGFSRCSDYYSIDALLRRRAFPPPTPASMLPIRCLQVFVSFIYVMTALSKTNPSWFNGEFMQMIRDSGRMGFIYEPFLRPYLPLAFLGARTVLTEYFLAVGLWIPRVRFLAAAAGIVMHLSIDFLMPVTTFSYQIIALYVVFFDFPAQAPNK